MARSKKREAASYKPKISLKPEIFLEPEGRRTRPTRASQRHELISADACNALVFVVLVALFAAWVAGL